MFRKYLVVGALAALVSLVAGSAMAGDKVKFGKISDGEWQIGPPEDYPEANAVVLLDKAELTISLSNIVIEYHVRIKVLTEAGVDEVGDQSISWHKKYDKAKKLKAHTITPDGKKHKVEKNAIFDKQVGNYKQKTFSFPVLKPGCVIEYAYRVVSKRLRYLKPWYFQGDVYTLKSTFSVTLPGGFVYNVLYQNVPPQFKEPTMEERPDFDSRYEGATIKTFTWVRENLPPITDEPYMSSEDDYRSSLRFQIVSYEDPWNKLNFQKGWEKLGQEVQDGFDDYCNKRKDIKKLSEEVTAGLATPREKSQAIFEFVTSEYVTTYEYNYWYFAREKIADLLQEKSGTGEEKNILLVEMHQAVDIPAWTVMISTRSNSKFDPGYPDLRQFDYIIAFVQFGNDYEFLDCANKLSPYGLLPPQCLTNGGLLVDGEKSQLVRIREKAIFSGRTDRTRMYVDSEGQVTCSTSCDFRGYYASMYGRRYERKQPDEFIEDYFMSRMDTEYTLGNYECRLDSADSFVMTVDYTAEDMVTQLDNNLLIKPVSYAYRSNPFKSEKRFFPVDFNYPFTYKNAVEIFVADDVGQYILPEDVSHRVAGASFVRESKTTDSSVVVVSTLIIDQPEFAPNVYSRLRNFFEQVALASEDEVTAILVSN